LDQKYISSATGIGVFKVHEDSNQQNAGLAMARLMEYLDFDAIVPGNHD